MFNGPILKHDLFDESTATPTLFSDSTASDSTVNESVPETSSHNAVIFDGTTAKVFTDDATGVIEIPTLSEISDLAWSLLDQHQLTAQGWTFAWDRAKRRLGACNCAKKRITLSRPIFSIEENRHEARHTILHEIAHALAGTRAGHGPKWKQIAVSIGARPQRCATVREPELPIVGVCRCGAIHFRVRMPSKDLTHRCRRCGSTVTWSRRAA